MSTPVPSISRGRRRCWGQTPSSFWVSWRRIHHIRRSSPKRGWGHRHREDRQVHGGAQHPRRVGVRDGRGTAGARDRTLGVGSTHGALRPETARARTPPIRRRGASPAPPVLERLDDDLGPSPAQASYTRRALCSSSRTTAAVRSAWTPAPGADDQGLVPVQAHRGGVVQIHHRPRYAVGGHPADQVLGRAVLVDDDSADRRRRTLEVVATASSWAAANRSTCPPGRQRAGAPVGQPASQASQATTSPA